MDSAKENPSLKKTTPKISVRPSKTEELSLDLESRKDILFSCAFGAYLSLGHKPGVAMELAMQAEKMVSNQLRRFSA
jgi:hypothetical protein